MQKMTADRCKTVFTTRSRLDCVAVFLAFSAGLAAAFRSRGSRHQFRHAGYSSRKLEVASRAFKNSRFCMCRHSDVPARKITQRDLGPVSQSDKTAEFSVTDMSAPITFRLVTDDGRVRVERNNRVLSASKKGYVDQQLVDIFDGHVRKRLFPVGNVEFPNVHINRMEPAAWPKLPEILPILMVYRTVDKGIGVFDASKLRLTRDRGVVGNRPCLILSYGESMLWVDPGPGVSTDAVSAR